MHNVHPAALHLKRASGEGSTMFAALAVIIEDIESFLMDLAMVSQCRRTCRNSVGSTDLGDGRKKSKPREKPTESQEESSYVLILNGTCMTLQVVSLSVDLRLRQKQGTYLTCSHDVVMSSMPLSFVTATPEYQRDMDLLRWEMRGWHHKPQES